MNKHDVRFIFINETVIASYNRKEFLTITHYT